MCFALLKIILNARERQQLMQQVMNSVQHGRSTLFEAKLCYCHAAQQGLPS